MKPKMVRIEGYTYKVKDQLRDLGAKWDADEKHWYIEEDKIEEANAIVAKSPPKEPREARPQKRRKLFHTRCPVCGTEWDIDLNK